MKRFALRSLFLCLLVLISSLPGGARAGAHGAPLPGGPAKGSPSPISLADLKVQVRQALGQQAVDHMKHRSTKSHAFTPPPEWLKHLRPTTAPRAQANAQELYVTDPNVAGYGINAEGVSWVQGAVASFKELPCISMPGRAGAFWLDQVKSAKIGGMGAPKKADWREKQCTKD